MNGNTILIAACVVLVVVVVLATTIIRRVRIRRMSKSSDLFVEYSTLVACRFCHQQLSPRQAHRRSCDECFETVSKRDEADVGDIKEDPPPLFEDLESLSYKPGTAFLRLNKPPSILFGSRRPGESHTHSIKEFMRYPRLHRERLVAALLAEISTPASLGEEDCGKGITRMYLSNAEATYRAHRPRSLGLPGIGRMDCYIKFEPHSAFVDDEEIQVKSHKLMIIHYVFATPEDVSVHYSSHDSMEEAKKSARDHIGRRYREVPSEHIDLAYSFLRDADDVLSDTARALQDLKALASVVLGPEKAEWFPEITSMWDITLRQLIEHSKECDSKTQVSLLINMLPSWKQSHKLLIQTVKLLDQDPDNEKVR